MDNTEQELVERLVIALERIAEALEKLGGTSDRHDTGYR